MIIVADSAPLIFLAKINFRISTRVYEIARNALDKVHPRYTS